MVDNNVRNTWEYCVETKPTSLNPFQTKVTFARRLKCCQRFMNFVLSLQCCSVSHKLQRKWAFGFNYIMRDCSTMFVQNKTDVRNAAIWIVKSDKVSNKTKVVTVLAGCCFCIKQQNWFVLWKNQTWNNWAIPYAFYSERNTIVLGIKQLSNIDIIISLHLLELFLSILLL